MHRSEPAAGTGPLHYAGWMPKMSRKLRGGRGDRPDDAGRNRVAGAARPASRERPAREWRILLIVFLAAFAVYANTLGHGYAVDDEIFTTANRFVQRGFAALPDIFAKGSTACSASSGSWITRGIPGPGPWRSPCSPTVSRCSARRAASCWC